MFLVLPHQLFDPKYLTCKEIILWEHPHYFTKYSYNKKKLILHRASMKYYKDELIKKGLVVKYYTFKTTPKLIRYHVWDPVDKIKLPGNPIVIDSPGFLLSGDQLGKYRNLTKSFFFNAFYMKTKKWLGIIPGVKSQDKHNRKKLPAGIKIPYIPSNKSDKMHIDEAIAYTETHFNNNYGDTEEFMFPVKRSTAKRWISHFVKYKIKHFGDYQDAISTKHDFLYHSLLSTSINIGLITPAYLIDIIIKTDAPINSKEGFVRQLFWREYQRYCYKFANFNSNYFGNVKKLTKKWYSGNVGIKPVDDCIKKAFKTGYLHHIERLMIIGNFMQLSRISPKEGYKWFMEFSCDSYEWVMHQNVLDMAFFCTGGLTMRRPYISSSNYILKMSDYKRDEWSNKWDILYKQFLKNNKAKLFKFRYHFRSLQ